MGKYFEANRISLGNGGKEGLETLSLPFLGREEAQNVGMAK